jgi:hypothetical protein
VTINIHDKPCVTVLCDDCKDGCWDEMGTPHFDSVDDADRWIRKNCEPWLFTADTQLCSRCWARRICAQEGHDWGEWFESASDKLTVWRYCERCSRPDYTVRADR